MSGSLSHPQNHWSSPTYHRNNSVINVGIIGYGHWGPKLARNIHQIPNANLVMVSDLLQERLEEVNASYPGVLTTSNYKELLAESLDAVIIATPAQTHYMLAKDALRMGRHVLVEKPITTNVFHAQELIDLAGQRGLTLMVGHTFQYNPAVAAVSQIVQSGKLGDVNYLDSIRVNLGIFQSDINVIWDLAPHDLSILRIILGADPIRVSARGGVYANVAQKQHDVVYITLFFADGVMANLRLSWLDIVKQRRLTIIGSTKMLIYDDIADDKVVIYNKSIEGTPYSATEEEFHASYRYTEKEVIPIEWVEPLNVECNHFLECIRTNSKPRSSGEEGLKIVKCMQVAQRSLLNDGVELPIMY